MKKISLILLLVVTLLQGVSAQTTLYCPVLSYNLSNSSGTTDSMVNGQVTELQKFLRSYYNLTNAQLVITGIFDGSTKTYVTNFQQDNGLVPTGIIGSVSRSKIASLCPSSSSVYKGEVSSSTTTTQSTNTTANLQILNSFCAVGALQIISLNNKNYLECYVPTTQSCLYNGQTIVHGSSVSAFQSPTVVSPSTCVQEVRTCNNGVLSGSYLNQSCSVSLATPALTNLTTSIVNNYNLSCVSPSASGFLAGLASLDGSYQTIAGHGVTACVNINVNQSHTSLEGTISYRLVDSICGDGCSTGYCTSPGIKLFKAGSATSAWEYVATLANPTAIGQTLDYQVSASSSTPYLKVCRAGGGNARANFAITGVALKGTTSNLNCSFNSQNILHGSSTTTYQSATVSAGSTCQSQVRTCSNGTLSGNYTNSTCSVLPSSTTGTTTTATTTTTSTSTTFSCTATTLPSSLLPYKTAFDTSSVRNSFIGRMGSWDGAYLTDSSYHTYANLVMFENTKEKKYLDQAVAQMNEVLGRRDDKIGKKDYTGTSRAVWSTNYYNPTPSSTQVPYVLHSAQLSFPMAYYAYLIKNNSCAANGVYSNGKTYKQIADEYVAEVRKTVAVMDIDYRVYTQTNQRKLGWFILPASLSSVYPNTHSYILPMNVNSAAGSLNAMMWGVTGEVVFKDKAERLYNLFVTETRSFTNSTYIWYYLPLGSITSLTSVPSSEYFTNYPDDFTHAILSYDFLRIYSELGLGTETTLLGNIARGFTRNVINSSNYSVNNYNDGTGGAVATSHQTIVGMMSYLNQYDTTTKSKIDSVYSNIGILGSVSANYTSSIIGISLYIKQFMK